MKEKKSFLSHFIIIIGWKSMNTYVKTVKMSDSELSFYDFCLNYSDDALQWPL